MAQPQLDRGNTASVLLCFSRGCNSKEGSRCDSSRHPDWFCAFNSQSSAHTQIVEPSFETVPDGYTQQRSSTELTLTLQDPVQSSAITNWSDEAEGLCAGSLHQCLELGLEGDRMGDKHMLAAQWFYLAATRKKLSWEVLNRSASETFAWNGSLRQVEGLMWRDSGPIRRYMIRWTASLYKRIHRGCATARWASNGRPAPRDDFSSADELEKAYNKIQHLELRFKTSVVWLSGCSSESTVGSDRAESERTSNLNATLSASDGGQVDNDPILEPCGIWSCKLMNTSINSKYSAAAEYFCETARPQKPAEGPAIGWDLLCWDIKKYFTRNRHADFLKKVPVPRRDEVGAFMVEVRYQVKMIHSGCAAYRRAQARKSAKTIQKPRESDIAKAYGLIRDLLPSAKHTE